MTRVSDALDDLRETNGLARTGKPPYANGSRYLSAIPPMLWADEQHLPPHWIWYRYEDPEGDQGSVGPVPARVRPRIYATLGSVAGGNDFGRPVFAAMLGALGRLDADVTFTIGPFERSRLGQIPPNVTVTAYLPQADAMTSDLVVSHAGSGTTVAALARGLPMVAVPMFADQFHNADRLVAAGVGRRVDPPRVAEDLTPAIEQVLDDQRYRINAQRVAAQIFSRPSPAQALGLLRNGSTRV
jgi:UDP:flavonoid glycosyltransferase YjiC (YdhE family)